MIAATGWSILVCSSAVSRKRRLVVVSTPSENGVKVALQNLSMKQFCENLVAAGLERGEEHGVYQTRSAAIARVTLVMRFIYNSSCRRATGAITCH